MTVSNITSFNPVSAQNSNPLSLLPDEIAKIILLPLFLESFKSFQMLSMASKDSESPSKRMIKNYNSVVKLQSLFPNKNIAIKLAVQHQLKNINFEGFFQSKAEEKSASCPSLRRLILKMVSVVSFGKLNARQYGENNALLSLVNLSDNLKRIRFKQCSFLTDEMFWCFKRLTGLEEIDFTNCRGLNGKIFQYLGGNVNLTKLNFGGCNSLKDECFSHFQTLTKLKDLSLRGCIGVTDRGLENLANLSNLKRFDLTACLNMTTACMKWLTNLEALTGYLPDEWFPFLQGHTNLQELDLNYSLLTGAGFSYLRNLPSFRKLNVSHCQLSEEGVKNITCLSGLEALGITLDDNWLKYIKVITSLQELDLSLSDLTGEGVPYLTTLSNLKTLDLRRCSQLTNVWHKSIQKFPNLEYLGFQLNELTGSFPPSVQLKGIFVVPGNGITQEQLNQFIMPDK